MTDVNAEMRIRSFNSFNLRCDVIGNVAIKLE